MKLCRIAAVAVVCTWAGIAAADDLSAWSKYQDITFSGYTGGALTDFPVLVRVSAEAVGQMLTDAADLRFVDANGDELAYEIDAWNPAGESLVWVKVPSLTQGASIRMYFGNPDAEAPAYASGSDVFGNAYVGVWHGNQGTDTKLTDSTGHGLPASLNGAAKVQAGILGNAMYSPVAAANNGLNVPVYDSFVSDASRFTISAWVQTLTLPANGQRLFTRKKAYSEKAGWDIFCYYTAEKGCELGVRGGNQDADGYRGALPTCFQNNGPWFHLMIVYDGSVARIYTNGVDTAMGGGGSFVPSTTTTNTIGIGRMPISTGTASIHGSFDEMRLLKTAASADWAKAEYQTMGDASFAVYGNIVVAQAQVPTLDALEVSEVTADSADVSVVLPDCGTPTAVSFWFGTDEENLVETPMGTFEGRTVISTNLTGLAHGTAYSFRFTAVNSEGEAATGMESFGTLGAPMFALLPAEVDVINSMATVNADLTSIGGAPTTVNLYLGTDADHLLLKETWPLLEEPQVLSYTFDCERGSTYYYTFQASNTMADLHVYDVWTEEESFVFAADKYWTGAAGGSSWNNPGNWTGNTVPGAYDTVVFNGTGLTAGQTIKYDANQTIYKLVIATTTAFKIGSADDATASYVLTLTEVERQDVEGTEGLHEFTGPVNVQADSNGESTWTIAGSSELRMNQKLGGDSAVTIVKKGAGTFRMNYNTPAFSGRWKILEGYLRASVYNGATATLRGAITVGGTEAKAYLSQDTSDAFFKTTTITVLTNGVATMDNVGYDRLASLHVKDGGVATIGGEAGIYVTKAEMTGGRINGGTYYTGYPATIASYASAIPSFFNAWFKFEDYNNGDITTADGAAVIDLTCERAMAGGKSDGTITKSGAGTVRLASSSTFNYPQFNFNSGRILADNTNGSATANARITCAAGTTLGGTGFIHGRAGVDASLTLKSGTASSFASIEPGTVDGETGEHIVGTLTFGRETAPRIASFGNYAKLKIRMDKNGNCDKLMVYGDVSLAATAQLEVEFMGTLEDLARLPLIRSRILEVAGGTFTGDFSVSCTLPYSRVTKDESGYVFSYIPPVRLLLY